VFTSLTGWHCNLRINTEGKKKRPLPEGICTEETCTNSALARGLCVKHGGGTSHTNAVINFGSTPSVQARVSSGTIDASLIAPKYGFDLTDESYDNEFSVVADGVWCTVLVLCHEFCLHGKTKLSGIAVLQILPHPVHPAG
jgi:hypothetical protein